MSVAEKLRGGLLLSTPAEGAGGRTGTWRVYRPVINYSKCTKCGICWLYCPENVIEWLEDKNVRIDYNYCKAVESARMFVRSRPLTWLRRGGWCE